MKIHFVLTLILLAGLQMGSAKIFKNTKPISAPISSISLKEWSGKGPVKDMFGPAPHIVGGKEANPHSYPHQVLLLTRISEPQEDYSDENSDEGADEGANEGADESADEGAGETTEENASENKDKSTGESSGEDADERTVSITVSGFCGGTLISDNWVLTAAHCVDFGVIVEDSDSTVPTDELIEVELRIYVVAGAHNRSDLSARGVQVRNVAEVHIYPEYDPDTFINDIALVKVAYLFNIDRKYVQSIRLPKISQKNKSFWNSRVTITGWGLERNSQAKPSQILRKVDTRVVSNFYCSFRFFFLVVHKTNICTSGWWAKGACSGDSGGPLIGREEDGEPVVLGITSFGFGLSCSWSWPSVFTRVSSYLDWIHGKTGIVPRRD